MLSVPESSSNLLNGLDKLSPIMALYYLKKIEKMQFYDVKDAEKVEKTLKETVPAWIKENNSARKNANDKELYDETVAKITLLLKADNPQKHLDAQVIEWSLRWELTKQGKQVIPMQEPFSEFSDSENQVVLSVEGYAPDKAEKLKAFARLENHPPCIAVFRERSHFFVALIPENEQRVIIIEPYGRGITSNVKGNSFINDFHTILTQDPYELEVEFNTFAAQMDSKSCGRIVHAAAMSFIDDQGRSADKIARSAVAKIIGKSKKIEGIKVEGENSEDHAEKVKKYSQKMVKAVLDDIENPNPQKPVAQEEEEAARKAEEEEAAPKAEEEEAAQKAEEEAARKAEVEAAQKAEEEEAARKDAEEKAARKAEEEVASVRNAEEEEAEQLAAEEQAKRQALMKQPPKPYQLTFFGNQNHEFGYTHKPDAGIALTGQHFSDDKMKALIKGITVYSSANLATKVTCNSEEGLKIDFKQKQNVRDDITFEERQDREQQTLMELVLNLMKNSGRDSVITFYGTNPAFVAFLVEVALHVNKLIGPENVRRIEVKPDSKPSDEERRKARQRLRQSLPKWKNVQIGDKTYDLTKPGLEWFDFAPRQNKAELLKRFPKSEKKEAQENNQKPPQQPGPPNQEDMMKFIDQMQRRK